MYFFLVVFDLKKVWHKVVIRLNGHFNDVQKKVRKDELYFLLSEERTIGWGGGQVAISESNGIRIVESVII